ncbi:MAG: branched-chain alpha-keto acid dehydrogenase subunit E2 [Planctomycetaceae bacterium]|nr:branched-chain alpha-keto acid dehydrogenase subunit E2 [Planctomycetaceae bacterium]
MPTEFKLPELGENIESAEVVGVLVAPGDTVTEDQSVVEVETDKATLEVPCPFAGKIAEVLVAQGDTIQVGQVVLTVDPAGNGAAAPKSESAKSESPALAAPAPSKTEKPAAPKPDSKPKPPAASKAPANSNPGTPVPAAPSVRQFAREIGVDIHAVRGSDPTGRISIDDVKQHARNNTAAPAAPRAAGGAAPSALPDFSKFGPTTTEPMSKIRRITADHLSAAWTQAPHVTLFESADITDLEAMRQKTKADAEKAGGKLTLMPMLLKLVAAALKHHPKINASIDTANQQIIHKDYCHVGIAADTPKGLVVPVIRDVDQKSIIDLSVEIVQLAAKARDGKLSLADMSGGVFTITNLGALGTGFFTPIINAPEAAILGVGRAETKPVYLHDDWRPRLMLPLSLSFDHRLVDGADGARFLHWLTEAAQQPMMMAM